MKNETENNSNAKETKELTSLTASRIKQIELVGSSDYKRRCSEMGHTPSVQETHYNVHSKRTKKVYSTVNREINSKIKKVRSKRNAKSKAA